MNRIALIEVFAQDLRYAIRSLRRSPAFTIAAVLTLAIGIGATTAIFSVVNATLLRPLPFPHPEQLISVTTETSEGGVTNAGASSIELRALDDPRFSVVGATELFARLTVGNLARATPARGTLRSMSVLIVTEIAVAIVLTAGAGWLVQSFAGLRAVNPGFTAAGRLVMSTSEPILSPTESWARFRTILDGIRAVPGVAHAGAAFTFPMLVDREGATLVAIAGGAPPDPSRARSAYVRVVTPGFFTAMGIRMIAGRDFNGDGRQATQLVAVVNRAFAQQFLAGSDPLRASLSFGYPAISAGAHTIVGVVDDVRYKALNSAPQPIVYIDQAQLFVPSLSPVFVISAQAGNPLALVPRLRSVMMTLSPDGTVRFQTATAVIADTLTRQRLGMTLMLIFGVVALVLASIGIYGVIAYASAQRRNELATRLALGASSGRVFWFVMGGGHRLTAIGVVLGVAGAYGGGLALASRVYAMRADDPLILAAAAATVAAVALLATLIPAIRASRLDPSRILRSE